MLIISQTVRTARKVRPTCKTCCSFLFSTSLELTVIDVPSSNKQFLRNTEWPFLIPNFTRIGQELWVTQSVLQRRATVTELFDEVLRRLTKGSIVDTRSRTDGRPLFPHKALFF